MLWRDVVYLITQVEGENEMGDPTTVDSDPRRVYANKKSVRQSEFYQAAQAGLRPELMFEVRSVEYQGEPKLRYGGKDYRIIRTYEKDSETIELICAGLVSD
jgi:SPP1 family predicted phage head-tail adaptor